MRFYNTLTRQDEEFKPLGSIVGIYTCGPTVYDYMHIGNLRTFLLSDILQRVIEFNGLKVKSVQNITDIDDKIIKRAKERNITISVLSQEYEKYFLEDIAKLNIKPKDITPHATEYIEKMQDYIKALIDKGFAYIEPDGSVYFDISKFPDYGKLSGTQAKTLKTETRILSDEYTKENVQDFALWKAEEKSEVGYDSPWGWGRPGWHIECSVMSQENLGDTFDIHVGGTDLIFPHHENEIAQSEAKTGKKFVNYFIHGAHILVEGQKMSKSLGNFIRLKDIEEKGIDPLSLRYLYLQTHYRQEMNFTWKALEAAQVALSKLRKNYLLAQNEGEVVLPKGLENALNDDLNIPKAISLIWENIDILNKQTLDRVDEVLGLNLSSFQEEHVEIPEEIQRLIDEREDLRKSGNYSGADEIRMKIEALGFRIEDTSTGIKVSKSLKIEK